MPWMALIGLVNLAIQQISRLIQNHAERSALAHILEAEIVVAIVEQNRLVRGCDIILIVFLAIGMLFGDAHAVQIPDGQIDRAGRLCHATTAHTRPALSNTGTVTRRASSASRGESTRLPGSGRLRGLRGTGLGRGSARLTVS